MKLKDIINTTKIEGHVSEAAKAWTDSKGKKFGLGDKVTIKFKGGEQTYTVKRAGEARDTVYAVNDKTGYEIHAPAASMELVEDISESAEQFFVQGRYKGEEWENLADETFSREEAQEFIDDSLMADKRDYEERAVSTDGKTILYRTRKPVKSDGGDKLSRHMPPEVHKRNAEFFDKYL